MLETGIAVVAAYLVSSVSFPYWIARRRGVDLRSAGSRKLSGTNLARAAGVPLGIAGGILDAAKGFYAVAIAQWAGLPLETQVACGVAAVAGQMWPVFHRFDGGRANATGWGFALAVDPIAALVMAVPVVFAALLRLAVAPRPTRILPLGALLSFAVWPAVIWEAEGLTARVLGGLAVLMLIVARRITAGLRGDLATGAPLPRVLANRALYDRSELQERGVVGI
ncbi:MAG TPA: glycerol-3-phosphate acyltransferase [Candidatus Limnocylindrales bacterium]|nr:glycerol-3-phosphate acyltransferase [Candidatus Limnocylindrales bacterium]